jgi:hypothetical protein
MLPIVLCVILLSMLGYASWYYFRCRTPKAALSLLWLLRAGITAVLLFAFFQPSCNLRTIVPGGNNLTILLDVSKSMRLFNADFSVTGLWKLLRSCSNGPLGKRAPLRIFFFGDSARENLLSVDPVFSDKHSYFPTHFGDDIDASDRSTLIISDGNWSNASLPEAMLADKNCRYVRLSSCTPLPFLKADIAGDFQRAIQDSALSVRIYVQGYTKSAGKLFISGHSSAKQLARVGMNISGGYFSDTISLSFPTSRAGRFLYRIDVRDTIDSGLHAGTYAVCDIVPHTLKARIYSAGPSLDARFIALALSKNGDWNIIRSSDTVSQTPDALFFLDWDNGAERELASLKPASVAAFMGCAPGLDKKAIRPDTFAIVSRGPDDSLTQRLLSQQIPPPSEMIFPGKHSFSSMRSLVGCRIQKTPQSDTLPFLAQGKIGGKSAFFCAVKNAWQMEFMPLSVTHENETNSFLDYIIGLVKKQVLQNLTHDFFMYPASSKIYENDSIDFRIVAPPEIESENGPPAFVRYSINKAGRSIVDTSISMTINPLSGDQLIRIRPLDAGIYSYQAMLTSKTLTMVYTDTLQVQNNDLEMSVRGQNTMLLNSFARPIEPNDTSAFRRMMTRDPGLAKSITVMRKIQVKQSWWLLILLFCLLGIEWLVRRKIGLDS